MTQRYAEFSFFSVNLYDLLSVTWSVGLEGRARGNYTGKLSSSGSEL